MEPIQNILNRIKWDSALNPCDYSIHYYDRNQDKLVEESCSNLLDNDSSEDKELRVIPFHRIRRVSYKGKVFWERAS